GQSHPAQRMASGTQASSLELQGEAHKEGRPSQSGTVGAGPTGTSLTEEVPCA
ncbi:mCG1030838, partial [Mus musculus]